MTDRKDANLSTKSPSGEPALGRSYWQIVWRQFRRNLLGMVGLAMVVFLFILAVFAPFLANKYPYYWRTSDEGLTFPLFRALSNLDLTLLAAFLLVLLIPVTRRILTVVRCPIWPLHTLRRAFVLNLFILAVATACIYGFRHQPDRIFIPRDVTLDGKTYSVIEERDYRREARENPNAEYKFPPVPYSPNDTLIAGKFQAPSAEHPLGTDRIGRSVAARVIFGTRVSLAVGFVAVGISVAIGMLVGGVSGYFGGATDLILQRIVEIFICFPSLFLILTIIAMFGPKLWLIMVAISLTSWTGIARFVRAEMLKVKTLDYVTAARALGFRSLHIIVRHALPNTVGPVIVSASFGIAGAITTEAALSFLGLGDPTVPSWGLLLAQARSVATEHPALLVIPGVTIFFAVLAYNLMGEGLRDALDPRMKI